MCVRGANGRKCKIACSREIIIEVEVHCASNRRTEGVYYWRARYSNGPKVGQRKSVKISRMDDIAAFSIQKVEQIKSRTREDVRLHEKNGKFTWGEGGLSISPPDLTSDQPGGFPRWVLRRGGAEISGQRRFFGCGQSLGRLIETISADLGPGRKTRAYGVHRNDERKVKSYGEERHTRSEIEQLEIFDGGCQGKDDNELFISTSHHDALDSCRNETTHVESLATTTPKLPRRIAL